MSWNNSEIIGKKFADVSVVIPCYNCFDTIERAVTSVWEQTLLPKEVILIDDCSNDDNRTYRKILHIAKQYEDNWILAVFLKKNVGPGAARNKGWELATSKYIAFLDSDDTWDPEKIELQYSMMESRQDLDLTGHKCKPFNKKSDIKQAEIRLNNVSIKQMLLSNRFATRTVMLKKSIPLRFKNIYRSEDLLLWCEIIHAEFNAAVIDSVLAYTYPSDHPTLSSNLYAMEKGELYVMHQLYEKQIINGVQYILSSVLSVVKYCKRCLVYRIRRSHE